MRFDTLLRERGAGAYAGFFVEHLGETDTVLDCGCGPGSITVGLAQRARRGRVVGVDLFPAEFGPAREYARAQALDHLTFGAADLNHLPFAEAAFSAVFCHSALETLPDPVAGLQALRRVLRPGGLVGVASAEYEGVVIAGPHTAVLQRFYALREALWLRDGANPRLGKHLRGLLHAAGFERAAAHLAYVSHGTAEAVARFGADRAQECGGDAWFAVEALRHGLLAPTELNEMAAAWHAWAASSAAFFGFTWSRALAWKPT